MSSVLLLFLKNGNISKLNTNKIATKIEKPFKLLARLLHISFELPLN
jgi:hypothetical protein